MPNQENQYTHELRVEGEVVRQPEAVGVVLVVFAELLAESDEHPVDPAEDVGAVVLGLGAPHGHAAHQHGSALLVEARLDVGLIGDKI